MINNGNFQPTRLQSATRRTWTYRRSQQRSGRAGCGTRRRLPTVRPQPTNQQAPCATAPVCYTGPSCHCTCVLRTQCRSVGQGNMGMSKKCVPSIISLQEMGALCYISRKFNLLKYAYLLLLPLSSLPTFPPATPSRAWRPPMLGSLMILLA